MSSELRELYQSVIIDHGRRPRNYTALAEANCHQEGFNPLCGDHIFLHAQKNNDHLEKISFEGNGCAICMASTSLMTESVIGKNIETIKQLFSDFHALVTQGKTSKSLGKLTVFAGVQEFPARVKCATLGWHTMMALLENHSNEPVSTECAT